jgi:hypothetical protein
VHSAAADASTRSLTDTVKTTGIPEGSVADVVTVLGRRMDGATVSTTPTVKLSLALLPALSLASHNTGVEPSAKTFPLDGVQVTVTFRSTSSVPVALNVTTAPSRELASARMAAGKLSTGAVVSVGLLTLFATPR